MPKSNYFRKYIPIFFILISTFAHSPVHSDTINQSLFGLHIHGIASGSTWPSTQFGYLRLWDSHTTWRDLEPTKGQWQFHILDRYVNAANHRGIKVLLTLGQTPAWAAARPQADSPYGPGASSEPLDLADWRRYVQTLALRYKGRIHAWEIWNEINVKHFYSGDLQRMAELERVAAEVLKQVDPENVVLSPSIQGGAFRQLDAYFKAGGGRWADAISHHFYASTELPEATPERIRKVREVMARHGLDQKPLWNTEMGWLIANSDGGYGRQQRPVWSSWYKPDPAEAAGFVARSYLLTLDGGIRHLFWYAWDNGAMGLAEQRGTQPKLAAQGYARIREWLVGADFHGCRQEDGSFWKDPVWVCHLVRDGQPRWIVWSEKDRLFNVPIKWQATHVQGLLGDKAKPSVSQVTVGPVPAQFSR
ncbi:MAG: endo-1,4-beta-xylanase [Pseudomonadota bacterium]